MTQTEHPVDYVYELAAESPLDFSTFVLPTFGVPVLHGFQLLAEVDLLRDGRLRIPMPADLASAIEFGRADIRLVSTACTPEPSTGRDRKVTEIRIIEKGN